VTFGDKRLVPQHGTVAEQTVDVVTYRCAHCGQDFDAPDDADPETKVKAWMGWRLAPTTEHARPVTVKVGKQIVHRCPDW
jgi:hypothetical protein